MKSSNHGFRMNRAALKALCIITALVLVALGAWIIIDKINKNREIIGTGELYPGEFEAISDTDVRGGF